MGITLIFVSQQGSDGSLKPFGLTGLTGRRRGSRKQPLHQTVPETDTGGQVEHTKALERMTLKELGNLPP
jgi:hypothetical protein